MRALIPVSAGTARRGRVKVIASACGLLVVLALLLAACGGSSTSGASTATNTPKPSATATATPIATVSAAQAAAICGSQWQNLASGPIYAIGDLYLAKVRLAGFAMPGRLVPSGTPMQPLLVGDQSGSLLSAVPPVNPELRELQQQGGYEINVCNASASASHVIQSVTVTLVSYATYAGPLNMWKPCDAPYSHAYPGGNGCGGVYFAAEYLRATFAANAAVGTQVTAQQTGSGATSNGGTGAYANIGPLPITLTPHQSIPINVGIIRPTADGTYGFGFAVTVDGVVVPTPAPEPALFAPVHQAWTGLACATFSAQIPPDPTPPKYYICPE